MTVDKKLIFVSAVMFLINAPLNLIAANVTITQKINPGGLEVIEMPTDMSFPALRSMRIEQDNYIIPEIVEEEPTVEGGKDEVETTETPEVEPVAAQRFVVHDLRFEGGFRLDANLARMTDLETGNSIPVDKIGMVTFHKDSGIKSMWRPKGETAEVSAPLSGDPYFPTDYKFFEESADPAFSQPLTILDGSVAEDGGRIGRWEMYPAFLLKLPPNTPQGRYQGSVTYTFVTQ